MQVDRAATLEASGSVSERNPPPQPDRWISDCSRDLFAAGIAFSVCNPGKGMASSARLAHSATQDGELFLEQVYGHEPIKCIRKNHP